MSTHDSAGCYIQQIGTAVPETWLDGDGSANLLQHACINARGARLLQRIARLTGIERRYLTALSHQSQRAEDQEVFQPAEVQPHGPGMEKRTELFEMDAGPLVLRAVSGLSSADLERVKALVTVSCTHASSPGLEKPLLARTPIPSNVNRWNLGFMGCSAGLAGLRLIHESAAKQADALIVACELSSLHFQYTDQLDQMTANVLFADGTAAVLTSASPARVRVIDCRCVALPEFADQMIWFAGDHGLKLRLSQDLPETLARFLPAAVERFLMENNLSSTEVEHWLVHPGGPQILDAVECSLSIPQGALHHSREVFRLYGNMSSPTIFFILKRVMESNATGRAIAMAFGPGLTIELVLIELLDRAVVGKNS